MPRYALPFENISTSASASTYKTLAALLLADTAGLRIRLRSLAIAAAATPTDATLAVQLKRVADVSAGGAGTPNATITTANIPKADANQANSPASGGTDYLTGGVEPSTYETNALFQMEFNSRGGLIKEWPPSEGPMLNADQLLGLLVTNRAAAAVAVSGTLEFETV